MIVRGVEHRLSEGDETLCLDRVRITHDVTMLRSLVKLSSSADRSASFVTICASSLFLFRYPLLSHHTTNLVEFQPQELLSRPVSLIELITFLKEIGYKQGRVGGLMRLESRKSKKISTKTFAHDDRRDLQPSTLSLPTVAALEWLEHDHTFYRCQARARAFTLAYHCLTELL